METVEGKALRAEGADLVLGRFTPPPPVMPPNLQR
jgi:hypothetical protein